MDQQNEDIKKNLWKNNCDRIRDHKTEWEDTRWIYRPRIGDCQQFRHLLLLSTSSGHLDNSIKHIAFLMASLGTVDESDEFQQPQTQCYILLKAAGAFVLFIHSLPEEISFNEALLFQSNNYEIRLQLWPNWPHRVATSVGVSQQTDAEF